MTRLLAEAFDKASQLPESLQNELAENLLDEIEWESRWDETLAATQDKLEQLADKALRDYQ
jgi:hypothetical protein